MTQITRCKYCDCSIRYDDEFEGLEEELQINYCDGCKLEDELYANRDED